MDEQKIETRLKDMERSLKMTLMLVLVSMSISAIALVITFILIFTGK
jgi:hypothetical protein